jgi:hypothetical protein
LPQLNGSMFRMDTSQAPNIGGLNMGPLIAQMNKPPPHNPTMDLFNLLNVSGNGIRSNHPPPLPPTSTNMNQFIGQLPPSVVSFHCMPPPVPPPPSDNDWKDASSSHFLRF